MNANTQENLKDTCDFESTLPWSKEPCEQENLPKNIVFPEELNTYLRDRIRDLTAENGNLRRALEETEEKLRKSSSNESMNSLAKSCQAPMLLGKPGEVATAKIVELSRKCREQKAEVEALKTKCKQYESQLASKTSELAKLMESGDARTSTDEVQPVRNEDEDRLKHLSEKLQQTQTKLYESKNLYASLKQEFNKAQKLLCSEVGENVSVATLSNQPGGWRGRAEQIRLLQQKVAELQSRLSEYDGKVSSVSLERKNLAIIRNAEKERRQQIENSAKELRQAEVALETSKRKLDAAKARIKVLENELNIAKANIAVLNEKRSHDDQLIETLNSRLKALENRYQEREIELKNKEEKMERDSVVFKNDLQAAQVKIDRLTRKLEEREIEIDKLRSGIVPEESMKPPRVVSPEERAISNYRPSPPNSIRHYGEPNEYVTLAFAAEAERERLLELVTVLNRRLDKERNETDSLNESLRNERSKIAKLELKLRKLEAERASIVKVDSGYRAKSLSKLSGSRTNEELADTEQIRFKLELLEEECLALKTRLNTVQQDKASDLEMYKRMLDQARKTFQDACRGKIVATPGSYSTITI